jgi:predicted peroxiredoxin
MNFLKPLSSNLVKILSEEKINYFIILTESAGEKIFHNKIIAGLRIALTLLMEEYTISLLFLENAADMLRKEYPSLEGKKKGKVTVEELLDGLISFGAQLYTCDGSLETANMTEEDLIAGVSLINLHNACLKINESDKVLTF